jgi:membrane associated rhomboid family serine protease
VRALQELRATRAGQINRQGAAAMSFESGQSSGKKVIVAEGLTKAFAGKPIIHNFDITIQRGDRVAFVGPNGVGKTSLIKMLMGDLEPDAGTIKHGTNLTPAVFDQTRAALNPDTTLWDNLVNDPTMAVSGKADQIMVRGDYGFDMLRRFVTYPFVHWSFQEAMFGLVMTLALGKFVGDAFGNLATLALWFVTGVAGAFAFGLILTGPVPLVGAFPPAYGLIGAYTYLIWLRLGQAGEKQLAAFRLIGFLMALQLVFGLFPGGAPTWIAEIAGFITGFALAPLLAPGGWQAFLARMRQR